MPLDVDWWLEAVQVPVSDVDRRAGVEVSEVQDFDWGSFIFFSDPDGNGWAVQQVPAGSPGESG